MASHNRILVVDDDPLMRELTSTKLADAGYAVDVAENGEEAWTLLTSRSFELVIADLDMPIVTGYELTERMRASKEFHQTPVIVITGSDHAEAVDKAFAVGATSFLAKPVNWSLLGHAVKFVLRVAQDQRALLVAKDQAEAGARFRDSLMSLMSHELRTPLNAIIGFGQIIGTRFDEDNDPVHKEYADYIVDGGKRLLNALSDMLLASDARSGPIKIDEADCTIEDIVQHAIASNDKAAALSEANIKSVIEEPELEIRCDRTLLSRAIGKLIENSIKFSGRNVAVTVATAKVRNGDLAIIVRDNGPGIARDKLKAAVMPFTQLDMSLRRSKEGLGLGLPLVLAIADAHGARFKLDATNEGGTVAVIVIPSKRLGGGSIALEDVSNSNNLIERQSADKRSGPPRAGRLSASG
ncbi:MAG: response regulator [Pseudomonadota bacterium]